jgi:hypothetical protein
MLTVQDFLQVDLPAMLACLFATLSCALLGNSSCCAGRA